MGSCPRQKVVGMFFRCHFPILCQAAFRRRYVGFMVVCLLYSMDVRNLPPFQSGHPFDAGQHRARTERPALERLQRDGDGEAAPSHPRGKSRVGRIRAGWSCGRGSGILGRSDLLPRCASTEPRERRFSCAGAVQSALVALALALLLGHIRMVAVQARPRPRRHLPWRHASCTSHRVGGPPAPSHPACAPPATRRCCCCCCGGGYSCCCGGGGCSCCCASFGAQSTFWFSWQRGTRLLSLV